MDAALFFQSAANTAAQTVFKQYLIADALAHIAQQPLSSCLIRKIARFLQHFIGSVASHVMRNKGVDECFFAHPVLPVVAERIAKGIHSEPLSAIAHKVLHGGAQTKAPCSCIEKTGPVRGVLHIVIECQQLLVVIEAGGIQLRDSCTEAVALLRPTRIRLCFPPQKGQTYPPDCLLTSISGIQMGMVS